MAISTVKATINGQQYSLTWNGTSGKWEANLTAPSGSSFNNSGGYYGVAVEAKDSFGNTTTVDQTHETLGTSLRLVVKEKVKPTATILSPSASAFVVSNVPAITFQLRDLDSGILNTSLSLKIDGGAAKTSVAPGMVLTPVTNGFDGTYTPQVALSDGAHTITVDISDNDGNTAIQATRTFNVDTVAPSLNVSSPTDNYETNIAAMSVIGVTNDITSSPVTIVITKNAVDQGVVTVDGGGNFTKAITLSEGINTIVIKATDTAGKFTTITRTVTLNMVPPVITLVEMVPNPADAGTTYIIKVTIV